MLQAARFTIKSFPSGGGALGLVVNWTLEKWGAACLISGFGGYGRLGAGAECDQKKQASEATAWPLIPGRE